MSSIFSIFGIITTLISAIGTSAASSVPIPLPRDEDYIGSITQRIAGSHFSTDPQGKVAAAGPTSTTKTENGITITITKMPSCTRRGDIITYRLTITVPDRCSATITQDIYPLGTEFIDAQRKEDSHDPASRTITWIEPALAPESCSIPWTFTYTIRLKVKFVFNRIVNGVVVTHGGLRALSDHVASDDGCSTPPSGTVPPLFSTQPLPPGHEPVIICDPAEVGCVPKAPVLGPSFKEADPYILQFANETQFTFAQVLEAVGNPKLGVRWKEAMADILPGECRAIPDDIILHPKFQDALDRRADPVNFFMMPIFNSEKDFKELVHVNDNQGQTHLILVKDRTLPLHRKYWLLHRDIIMAALEGKISGSTALSQLNALLDQWRAELNGVMVELQTKYTEMQLKRKENYPRILCEQDLASYSCTTCKAEDNVKSAIARACGIDADAGFCAHIDRIKLIYEQNLASRLAVYPATQSQFLTLQPVVNLWNGELAAALAALDGGDKGAALRKYFNSFGIYEQNTYDTLFKLYQEHARIDRSLDENVRIGEWEKSLEGGESVPYPYDPNLLDAPKKVVVDCTKEKIYKHHVETTWCEVGEYPELMQRAAPEPRKAKLNNIFLPDTSALDGSTAVIDESKVRGTPCNPGPGNPWWAEDCSCQCDDLLPMPNVGILICPAGTNVIRHDYYITSQEECLADKGFDDHFLPAPAAQ